MPTFMAFFAGKTIAAIRAPDQYVYVAPFNCAFFSLSCEVGVEADAGVQCARW